MSESEKKEKYLAGIISDTHGMLRSGIYEAFKEVDLIVHAGDVGSREVLKELEKIAPVTAVQGNMDGRWASNLQPTEIVQIGEVQFYVLHDLWLLDLDPKTAGFHAVISGHTHKPKIEHKDGILYLNPGSAGPRRFDYPISAALLEIQGTRLHPRIVEFAP
ncbi:MAG: metallophosphoesterase family protein [Desulfobacterales bacterium]